MELYSNFEILRLVRNQFSWSASVLEIELYNCNQTAERLAPVQKSAVSFAVKLQFFRWQPLFYVQLPPKAE